MKARADRIKHTLSEFFDTTILEIADDSARHAGHAGAQPEGETHFKLTIVAAEFEGMTRIKRHQAVYAALKDEFATGLHALNIRALTPEEAKRGN